jgi:hypothetical protein
MKSMNRWGRVVLVAASFLLLAGGTAFAQLQTGNLYGKVVDQKGSPLPGVTLTLETGEAPQVQVSNAQGEFRFLSLAPATYKLKAELAGFSTIEEPNIVISVGRNTNIVVTMNSALEEVITVTAESPLLDERKISTGATINATELQKIPTSRDPWAVLQTTPGVLTDRVNVGGNESGQQSSYVGPGSVGQQSVWAVDGVVITDMAALGSSPAYYDFDAFQEMQVTTGGSDSTLATGGVVLNLVTKRGTNEWRGSARYLYDDKNLQSNTSFNASRLPAKQPPFKQGNRIVKVQDYGFEAGGPIVKDRLWIWGSYGKQDIKLLTISDFADNTQLPTLNGKLNAQVTSSNSATAFVLDSSKKKQGRNAGPTRPQETTWNQDKFGPSPTALKLEDTQILGPNFYLTGLISQVEGGFELVPQGGFSPTAFLDSGAIWHFSFRGVQTKRPQQQGKLDASSFFNTGTLSHELKYGAGYRRVETQSFSTWPGAGLILDRAVAGLPGPFAVFNLFEATRPANLDVKQNFTSVYAQDTATVGNFTFNVGVRYDRQGGQNQPSSSPANPSDPAHLPAVSYGGGPIGFTWTSFTPRLGLTYALGKDRKTLLRASYSRFADQMGAATAAQLNPIGSQGYYYLATTDSGPAAPSHFFGGFGYSSNVNPFTGGLLQSSAVDHNLKPPKIDEVLASIEHSLLPELVIGLNLTYRKFTDILQQDLLVFDSADPASAANVGSVGRPSTAADFHPVALTPAIPGTLPNGQAYVPISYRLNNGISTRNGTILRNGNREQTYKGASLVFNKRLASRWMMRGNVTYADWKWTNVTGVPNPTEVLPGGFRNGDAVLQGSGTGSGSKGDVYINSKWSYSLNGLYQIMPDRPWGFNVAGVLTGRQGYSNPYFVRKTLPSPQYEGAPFEYLLIDRPDTFRLDNINVFDARIEKELTFQEFGLTLGVDCFNVFNKSYILQRQNRLGLSTTNFVREILSPRIFRLGARVTFR